MPQIGLIQQHHGPKNILIEKYIFTNRMTLTANYNLISFHQGD